MVTLTGVVKFWSVVLHNIRHLFKQDPVLTFYLCVLPYKLSKKLFNSIIVLVLTKSSLIFHLYLLTKNDEFEKDKKVRTIKFLLAI